MGGPDKSRGRARRRRGPTGWEGKINSRRVTRDREAATRADRYQAASCPVPKAPGHASRGPPGPIAQLIDRRPEREPSFQEARAIEPSRDPRRQWGEPRPRHATNATSGHPPRAEPGPDRTGPSLSRREYRPPTVIDSAGQSLPFARPGPGQEVGHCAPTSRVRLRIYLSFWGPSPNWGPSALAIIRIIGRAVFFFFLFYFLFCLFVFFFFFFLRKWGFNFTRELQSSQDLAKSRQSRDK
jgi:hypothetical protein